MFGPRRHIANSPTARFFWVLLGVSGLVLLHDLLGEFEVVGWKPWVGVTASATFVFAAVSLSLTQRQFAMAQAPYLRYQRGQDRNPDKASQLGLAASPLWYVEVSNAGNGTATLRDDITYDVEVLGDDDKPVREIEVKFTRMLEVVQSATGFADEQDFVFSDWQKGMAIRPGEPPLRLWEMPLELAQRIRRLDARLRYGSMLGDVYELDVSFVPPRGLPALPAATKRTRRRS